MVLPSAVTLDYTVDQHGGASLADLAVLIAKPPVPQDLLEALGTRLVSDVVSTSGSSVRRRIIAALHSDTSATLLPVFTGDGQTLTGVTVSAPGSGYVTAPHLTVLGNTPLRPAVMRALMNVQGVTIVQGGLNYTTPSIFIEGGLEIPQVNDLGQLTKNEQLVQGCVQALSLVDGGRGYSKNAVVTFDGVLAPNGHWPTVQLTKDSKGTITSLVITDTGAGLVTVPKVTVFDPGFGGPGGKGAKLAPMMGIGTAATVGRIQHDGSGTLTSVLIQSNGGPYVRMPRFVVQDALTGSGAVLVALMGISQVDLFSGGKGYNAAVHHSIAQAELFPQMFETFTGVANFTDASPFWNLMKGAIEAAVNSPVTAAAPAVS